MPVICEWCSLLVDCYVFIQFFETIPQSLLSFNSTTMHHTLAPSQSCMLLLALLRCAVPLYKALFLQRASIIVNTIWKITTTQLLFAVFPAAFAN